MTRRTLVAVTFTTLFVGSLPAQTLPDPESSAPNLQTSTLDSQMSASPEAIPPIPANGVTEAYNRTPSNGPGAGLWISADYLLGWFQPARLPALVTTSPAGTPRAQAGVLGLASTSVLFDGRVNGDVRSGLQFGVGYWFDAERTFALEASFSVFESQSALFWETSTGTPILARPFTNAVTSLPDSVVIAFPGSGSGAVAVRDSSGNFYEFHLDLSERICGNEWFRLDGLVGYRFYRYDEGLRIEQTISPTGGAFAPGTQISATDSFVAENEFNGFDLGFRAEARIGNWTLDFLSKLATGGIFQDVRIRGN